MEQRMNGLPCIRRGADSWRLPLSRQASDAIAAMLLGGADPPDVFASLFRIDPPLLIYAVLTAGPIKHLAAEPSAKEVTVDLGRVAADFAARLSDLLCTGESCPGPANHGTGGGPYDCDSGRLDRAESAARVEKLRRKFLRLPLSRWMAMADQWLELAGPTVPVDWKAQWPSISDSDRQIGTMATEVVSYSPCQLDLSALARRLRRGEWLHDSFSDAVREAKRAALKQFAYGLSHEINNPLANISTRAQTLIRGEADLARQQSLQRIVDQAMRAHEMTADLMFYAHPPVPKTTLFDLRDAAQVVVKQFSEAIQGREIELIVDRSPQAVYVQADRAMMIEAIRSLVRNAIEAIGCDGRVLIDCEIDVAESVAVVTVCDSGPGLSAAAAEHAFDPYFSGREAGRGLGVGLCRVAGIAKVHGGDVSLKSGPAGCIARVWIPVAP